MSCGLEKYSCIFVQRSLKNRNRCLYSFVPNVKREQKFTSFVTFFRCETTVQMLLLTNTDLRLHYIIGRVKTRERIRCNVNFGVCDSTVHYSSIRYRFTCYPFCAQKNRKAEELIISFCYNKKIFFFFQDYKNSQRFIRLFRSTLPSFCDS